MGTSLHCRSSLKISDENFTGKNLGGNSEFFLPSFLVCLTPFLGGSEGGGLNETSFFNILFSIALFYYLLPTGHFS